MLSLWDDGFKIFFLKYLNSLSFDGTGPFFQLPPSSYAWIDSKVQQSIAKFKFDLYDKYAIINLKPDFTQTALIELLGRYI
jgi:hypothetical protein